MKWSNLQSMLCPQCSSSLEDKPMGYHCEECDFFIGHEKFQSVVGRMYNKSGDRYSSEAIDRSDWE